MTKKNQPGCPCCDCDLLFDDFNRSDDTDVGGNYTEEAGGWQVFSNLLYTGDSDALLTIDVASGSASGVLAFYFYAFDDDDEVIAYVDYTDADNHHFVKFTANDPMGCIEIYERASGTNTLISSVRCALPSDAYTKVYIYWGERSNGDYELTAYALGGGGEAAWCYGTVTGFTTDEKAIGTGTVTTGVYFENLYLWKHYSPTDTECWEAPQACTLVYDTFTDFTETGCSWEESGGSWSISTSTATTSTAGAMIISQNRHPYDQGRLKLQTAIYLNTVGASAKIWIEHEKLYLQLTRTSSTVITSELFDDATGSLGTAKATTMSSTNNYIVITICYDGSYVFYTASFTGGFLVSASIAVTVAVTGRAAIEFESGSGSMFVAYGILTKMPDDETPGCVPCVEPSNCCIATGYEAPFAVRVELGAVSFFTDSYCTECSDATKGSKIIPFKSSCTYEGQEPSCDYGLDGLTHAQIAAVLTGYGPAECDPLYTWATEPVTHAGGFLHQVTLNQAYDGGTLKNYWQYWLRLNPQPGRLVVDPTDSGAPPTGVDQPTYYAIYKSAYFITPCDDFPFTLNKDFATTAVYTTRVACNGAGGSPYWDVDAPRNLTCDLGTIPATVTLWGV